MSFGNVFILGDSYSTYDGCIPEGYPPYYYPCTSAESGGVRSPEKTWWGALLAETNAALVMNNSWSGSTVCLTGYDNSYCPDSAFVNRIQTYLRDGQCGGQTVDTVFVFGGTNDSWANSPLGEEKYADWTDADLRQFFPAFCFLQDYLKKQNPSVRVITLINCDLKEEVMQGMADICERFGTEYVVLKEIEKQNGHPNETGMLQIKEQILAAVKI